MSTKVIEQSLTVRTEPGDLKATIERYKTNGWTVEHLGAGTASLTNPLVEGVLVKLQEQP